MHDSKSLLLRTLKELRNFGLSPGVADEFAGVGIFVYLLKNGRTARSTKMPSSARAGRRERGKTPSNEGSQVS